jgi:hypothetical protein
MEPQLARKLAAVLGEVGYIQKDGYNSHFKYSYITEAALTETIRPLLAKHNLFVFSSIENQRIENGITLVETMHTFMDGDTGETFAVKSQGQGQAKDDKGVYKAATGAMKYFLYKTFMVSTGDDPETDGDSAPAQRDRGTQTNGNGSVRPKTPPAGDRPPTGTADDDRPQLDADTAQKAYLAILDGKPGIKERVLAKYKVNNKHRALLDEAISLRAEAIAKEGHTS